WAGRYLTNGQPNKLGGHNSYTMIIHLKNTVAETTAHEIGLQLQAIVFKEADYHVLVTPFALKAVPDNVLPHVQASWPMDSDIQLASKSYQNELRSIKWGNTEIGGNTKNTVVIAGPCSIESWEQIESVAKLLKSLNISTLRAGCYKPRTSPYTFQGLGLEGLKMLAEVRRQYGLNIITEVKDSSHIEEVIEYTDIVQIGAKAMYDQSILRRCGEIRKPILLKRGFGTTLQEFVQAAEFILSGGNPEVILCERGIRTFETKTRFTFDLCGAAWLKQHTNCPVILDPSHAMGYAYGVPDLAKASVAFGCDGLLIETHPNPKAAKSDAAQQLDFEQFTNLMEDMRKISAAVGREII
ncbi:MAG: 3-deoxy-7-phosphoheptulonate synthase, partial [Saprospiraceae bacterium]|nr:3-deoxy-7-phosphoheptulonate synthase [Saprospiraceae bacterium]